MLSPPCKKEMAIYMKRKRGNTKKQKGAKARMQKKPMADGTKNKKKAHKKMVTKDKR